MRLFCFAHAGGGASVYRGWQDGVPDSIEIAPIQLPGRETRFLEPPFRRFGELVDGCAAELRSHIDLPFALFGHSMGAFIAFEVLRRLVREPGAVPVCLQVSAARAPQLPERESSLHLLSDAELMEKLRELECTPPAVFADRELMQFFLPRLRADFELCAGYRYQEDEPLACPVFALGGRADTTVTVDELDGWRSQTAVSFERRLFDGGHGFLQSPSVLPVIVRALQQAGQRLGQAVG